MFHQEDLFSSSLYFPPSFNTFICISPFGMVPCSHPSLEGTSKRQIMSHSFTSSYRKYPMFRDCLAKGWDLGHTLTKKVEFGIGVRQKRALGFASSLKRSSSVKRYPIWHGMNRLNLQCASEHWRWNKQNQGKMSFSGLLVSLVGSAHITCMRCLRGSRIQLVWCSRCPWEKSWGDNA